MDGRDVIIIVAIAILWSFKGDPGLALSLGHSALI